MPADRKLVEGKRRIIQRGSKEHRTMLGIDAAGVTTERKAELELALKATPEVQPEEVRKTVITPDNFRAADRYGPGDEIYDGWYRKGDH